MKLLRLRSALGPNCGLSAGWLRPLTPDGMKVEVEVERCVYTCVDAGIILEYEQGGFLKTKSIDLLDLRPE